MVIRFQRKKQPEWLMAFVLTMPFCFFLLIDIFHLPYAVRYSVDLALCCLMVLMALNRVKFLNTGSKKLAMVVFAFLAITVAGLILRQQRIWYYLWGLRNSFRFYVFFFGVIFFLRQEKIEGYLKYLDVLFYINVPVVLIQFFLLNKSQDYLGGIFGVEKGGNAYLNVFHMVIVAKAILSYLHKKESLKGCALKCAFALLIAVFAELKIFVVEFLIILIAAVLMTDFSMRKLWIILGSAVLILLFLRLMALLFPWFGNWFSLKGLLEMATSTTGYTNSGDMNRLTAIPMSWERFLKSPSTKLFGLGLGSCDRASFSFLTTPFYRAYSRLHYMWFSSSFLLLETGALGLTAYVAFFVTVYVCAGRREKQANPIHCQLAKILSLLCLLLTLYDGSLRTEAAYVMFFTLALPFVEPS